MFEVNPGVSIWTIVTFIVLLIILRKFAWKPILTMLDARENRIKDSLEMADQIKTDAVESLNEYKKLILEAKDEHTEIITNAERVGEKTKENIIKKANLEGENILEKSRKQIIMEKEQALEEVKKKSIELSISMATKLVSTVMTEEQKKKFTKKAIEDIAKKL